MTTTTRTAVRKVAKKATATTTAKGRVATKPVVAKPEPKKIAKPKVTAPVEAEVKAPRVATKPKTAVAPKPTAVTKPDYEHFAFLVDGEHKVSKTLKDIEAAKAYAEAELMTDSKKGWTVEWKGNRGGYTATRLNSRGTEVDSPVVIKRTGEDGKLPTPKVKAEPLGFDEFGYRNGSDASIAAHILVEGGRSRSEINERVAQAIKEANGSLLTRTGSEKVIPTIVGNVVMRLREKGYKIESAWRLVPPTTK
jgi:hypothetical protein